MVPVYAVVAWLGTYFYKNDVYYDVMGNCYEAFAISAFFSLMCAYIAPDLHSQKEYFRGVEPKPWVWPIPWMQKCMGGENGIWRTPRSGLTWFNVSAGRLCAAEVMLLTRYLGHLGGRFPILSPPSPHDHRRGHHAGPQLVLRGIPQPCFLAYLGTRSASLVLNIANRWLGPGRGMYCGLDRHVLSDPVLHPDQG